MKYAQTGIRGYVPPGGVCPGHAYEDRPDQDNPHMSVNCLVCEPHLAKDPLWAATPSQVPLTELEQRQLDEQKARADAVTAQMMAQMANQAMATVAAQAQQAQAEAAAATAAATAGPKRTRARKPAAAKTLA
jgi:hypothetical protein